MVFSSLCYIYVWVKWLLEQEKNLGWELILSIWNSLGHKIVVVCDCRDVTHMTPKITRVHNFKKIQ